MTRLIALTANPTAAAIVRVGSQARHFEQTP